MNINTGKILFIVLALFAVSCASTGTHIGSGAGVVHQTLAPRDIHEDCMKAMPGQKIVYAFEASMPVNFNIHYHDEGKINYAVYELGASRVDESIWPVEKEQHYCLMWTNTNAADVQLSYTCRLTD